MGFREVPQSATPLARFRGQEATVIRPSLYTPDRRGTSGPDGRSHRAKRAGREPRQQQEGGGGEGEPDRRRGPAPSLGEPGGGVLDGSHHVP